MISRARVLSAPAFLLAAAVMLFASGCATKNVSPDYPENERISYSGNYVSPYAWENAETWDPDNPPSYQWTFSWLLPLNIYEKFGNFESSEKLQTAETTYNGLGFPLFLLPLRVTKEQNLYGQRDVYPIHATETEWNLLFANTRTSEDWPRERPVLDATGIPLFFSKGTWRDLGTRSGRRTDIMGWQTLWSLGPAWVTYKSREADRRDPRDEQRATIGMPLALGGLPGAVLWFDADYLDDKQYETARFNAHGPLFGMLGWFRSERTARWNAVPNVQAEDDPRRKGYREEYQGLIGGLLWFDQMSVYDAVPDSKSSAHGPVWGMFGWGERDGESVVRLFWIPVRV
jgi:hypothetical protein